MKAPHAASATVPVGMSSKRRRDHVHRPAERAVLAARAVERLAGWTCRPGYDVVPPSLPCLGLENRIDTLVIPATVVLVQTINRTLREARCDAFVVVAADEPGSNIMGELAFERSGTSSGMVPAVSGHRPSVSCGWLALPSSDLPRPQCSFAATVSRSVRSRGNLMLRRRGASNWRPSFSPATWSRS